MATRTAPIITSAACSQAKDVTFKTASNIPPIPAKVSNAPPVTNVVTPAPRVAFEFSVVKRMNPIRGFVGILRRYERDFGLT
jgi:hypothetical protein